MPAYDPALDRRVEKGPKARQSWPPTDRRRYREADPQAASEKGCGYTRILGELRKLNIRAVSRNTVKIILKRNGDDPGLKRGVGASDKFRKLHADTLWQCDFFSKRALTSKGFRDLLVLVFLHIETRRVFITPSTFKPDEACMLEQTAAFLRHVRQAVLPAEIIMRDRDSKFSQPFDDAIRDAGLKFQTTAFRSPNTVVYVERFIRTIQKEVLDHFIVFDRRHMDHLCS